MNDSLSDQLSWTKINSYRLNDNLSRRRHVLIFAVRFSNELGDVFVDAMDGHRIKKMNASI